MQPAAPVTQYLSDCRQLTLDEIARHVPRDGRHTAGLYELMLDYPLRPGKALRPALCIAVCRALNGDLQRALPSAAALELFHSAFLVHDDVEDGTELRRHGPTLHTLHGVPIAVNVGDGLLATALEPLLFNTRALGVGPSLRILRLFARMARESAEGQMLELAWMRQRRWPIRQSDYIRLVHKKTGWYSFIAPVQAGAIAASADDRVVSVLGRFALLLGIAFQIKDDLLSLERVEDDIGKDTLGDLWEGKYTLPLLHALGKASESERARMISLLSGRRRATARDPDAATAVAEQALFDKLERAVALSTDERATLEKALLGHDGSKDADAVGELARFVRSRDGESLRYARDVARRHADRARRILESTLGASPRRLDGRFLEGLVDFVVDRSH